MKIYEYEGKTEEEVILKALNELNVKEDELIYKTKEEITGLLKKKRIKLRLILKTDVIEYSKEYLNNLVTGLGLDLQLETKREQNCISIKMNSNNNSILIGKKGKTLESIQILLRQSIFNKTGIFVNIILNVENYKEKQEKNIQILSKKLAKEVLQTQIEIKMDSMNSYERRIVHETLKNYKGIKTESEGEEPNRSVVIKPSK